MAPQVKHRINTWPSNCISECPHGRIESRVSDTGTPMAIASLIPIVQREKQLKSPSQMNG